MKTVLVGDCATQNIFNAWDADAVNEDEVEFFASRALACRFSNYKCFVFTGSFNFEGKNFQPDLALVANDLSHWFIIEVELLSHSLEGHVLPQVIAFNNGDPQPDCLTILSRELRIDKGNASTLLNYVPRSVAVVANKYDPDWEKILRSHRIQFLTISVLRSAIGCEAVELNGTLTVAREHLGFGQYRATDKSLLFPDAVAIPSGKIQIHDPVAGPSIWVVTRAHGFAWITKERGTPTIPDGNYVQIIKTADGRLLLGNQ